MLQTQIGLYITCCTYIHIHKMCTYYDAIILFIDDNVNKYYYIKLRRIQTNSIQILHCTMAIKLISFISHDIY